MNQGNEMKRQFSGSDETPNIVSDGFIEATWEMLIALGTAAAICVGVVTLAAHLNATRHVRGIAAYTTQAPDATNPRLPAGVPRISTKPFHEDQWVSRRDRGSGLHWAGFRDLLQMWVKPRKVSEVPAVAGWSVAFGRVVD
jgi:hypothetical protein